MIKLIKNLFSLFFSTHPRVYRILFGPIRGMKIFISYKISPRMLLGLDEYWLARTTKSQIKQGDTIYDVGAHVGYTSLLFAKFSGQNGQIHAFELLPNVAHGYLAKTIAANRLEDQIIIHPIGLSNCSKIENIVIGDTMMGNCYTRENGISQTVLCRIETLDNYIREQQLPIPQFIKVDIETAENNFIRGAEQLIKQHHPILLIEFHNLALLKEGFILLKEMGYELEDRKGKLSVEKINNFHSFYGSVLAKHVAQLQ